MYLKVGNEFADAEFYYLEKFLKMIDTELTELNVKIKNSKDPDSEGLCDFGEHFIGYGFIAIQRYFTSTYPQTNIKKRDVLKVGPKITGTLFLAEVLNAGANYSKHEAEWPFVVEEGERDTSGLTPISIDRSGKQLKGGKGTFEIITKITPYADYTLSNLLAEILKRTKVSEDLLFSPLLPLIEEWRYDLDQTP